MSYSMSYQKLTAAEETTSVLIVVFKLSNWFLYLPLYCYYTCGVFRLPSVCMCGAFRLPSVCTCYAAM